MSGEMAEQGIQMDQEKLCCSTCPDLLKDPVTISCGHNSCLSLTGLGEADSPRINIGPSRDTEDVSAAVSEAREKLQDIPGEEWTKMSLGAPKVEISLPHAEPKTRDEFLKYSCEITLDQNTAHKCLSVSRSMAEHKYLDPKNPSYNDHPDRFTDWFQVLCREGLIGQCYWEVERKGEVFVAVAYKSIRRVGRESDFGYDDSWALQCFDGGYEFRHDIIRTPISGPQSSRVGVYLDHRAGILSFYSVSETMTLLLRVHTTFTQPLYAGLGMQKHGASAEICNALTT